MADLTPRRLAFCALGIVVALALGLHRLSGGDAEPSVPAAPLAVQDAGPGGKDAGRVVVHVAGAVRRPGVYRLPDGARVEVAVRRAGGATRRADLSGLNLAAPVQDGRQVLVPERAAASAAVGGGAAGAAADGAAASTPGSPGAPQLNLNTATLEQLDGLSGIGPTTAQKILDVREEHGGFGSVEELGDVPGIGPKRLETLRAAVTV